MFGLYERLGLSREEKVASVVRMRDVAIRAQVSVSTVANVVNQRTDRMDPQILGRVTSAITELGYHTNHMARSFKTGSTSLLGLLVPSISNPVYGTLAREIETVANNIYGFRVLIGNSYRDVEKERDFLKDMLGHGVKGVMIVSPSLDMQYYQDYMDRGLIVVSYDRRSRPGSAMDVDHISTDNFEACYVATAHLIEMGHRQIAYVTPLLTTNARSEKIRGFEAAARDFGLTSSSQVIKSGHPSYYEDAGMAQLGADTSKDVSRMVPRPTGLVAMNDLLALGLVSGLNRQGIQVPHDISVVGMDDLFISEIVHPGITTVRAPLDAMARKMVERLVGRLQDKDLDTSEFIFAPTLIVRQSVRQWGASPKRQEQTGGAEPVY